MSKFSHPMGDEFAPELSALLGRYVDRLNAMERSEARRAQQPVVAILFAEATRALAMSSIPLEDAEQMLRTGYAEVRGKGAS